MADQVELSQFLEQHTPTGDFKPYAYYGEEEDALTFYFRDEPDYAKRLNSRVTVYLSLENDELTGCLIKNVRHVLEDIGWFDVEITHGKANLKMLFLALHGTFADGDDARHLYRKLGEVVSQTGQDIEVELPPLAGASA